MSQNISFSQDIIDKFNKGNNLLQSGMQSGNKSDIDKGIGLLEEVADAGSHGAMAKLASFYPLVKDEADSDYVIKRLRKFSEFENSVAMVELGRIYIGSESDNPYLQRFNGISAYSDPEEGMILIRAGVSVDIDKNMNRLDCQHYYGAFCAYQYYSRKTRTQLGSGETFFIELSCWKFIRMAVKWAKENGAPQGYIDLYETSEKVIEELVKSRENFDKQLSIYEKEYGKV